jgi:succinate-semialdehyde dehydrogenase/glutarate-semialdehyde dehydrogenase
VRDSISDAVNSEPRHRATYVQSIDPATGAVFREYAAAGEAEIIEAVQRAQRAQPAWAALPMRDRRDCIEKLHDVVFEKSAEIARLISKENGKPVGEALSCEIGVVLDIARFYVRHAERILKPRLLPHQNLALKFKQGWQTHQPYGVVAIISPWNYPFMLALGQIIPALIAGNCVVHKPSEFTPAIGVLLKELFEEAGLPENVFTVVPGDATTGAALVDAPVDKVFFTGSAATGRKVAVAASQRLIPVGLELGGSDPFIVLQDANLEHASSGAVWGRFMTCGQSCIAPKRVLVERQAYEPFVELLIHKVKQLRLGRGDDPSTDVGPMIRERQVVALQQQLEDAIAKGARVLFGGRRREDLGPWFFEPTLLVDVKPSMLVMQEETFGPLLPVVPVADVDEAVSIANATPYGLSASVWTSDLRRGREIAGRVQAGAVLINDVMSQNGMCDAPRNGVKMSGHGYTNGKEGLLEMVRGKYIDSDAITAFRKPWWFRYTPKQTKNLDHFLSFLHAPTWRQRLAALPGTLALLLDKDRT